MSTALWSRATAIHWMHVYINAEGWLLYYDEQADELVFGTSTAVSSSRRPT